MIGPAAAERNADLKCQFLEAAAIFRRRDSVLYAELSVRAAHDAMLIELASQARPGQPAVHMLLAAVHFLVLGDPDAPLNHFFQSPVHAEQAFPVFRDFCVRHADEIKQILTTRNLQMTNADRAGYLMPAIALVAQEAGEPLSLVEVGCSAGLLTIFDHYAYDYGPLGRLGDPGGALVAGCGFRGTPPALPNRIPRIGFRIGLDLSPVDPRQVDEQRWIVALTPPHLTEARSRLKEALEYRAAFDLRVIAGDALTLLPAVLQEAPGPVCLFHSSCLYQWPIEARAAFSRVLCDASMTRTIHRISIEHRDFPMAFAGKTAEDSAPPPDIIDADLVANIDLVVYERGQSRVRRLGYYDGQGQAGRWVA
jgi:hypothetical protein